MDRLDKRPHGSYLYHTRQCPIGEARNRRRTRVHALFLLRQSPKRNPDIRTRHQRQNRLRRHHRGRSRHETINLWIQQKPSPIPQGNSSPDKTQNQPTNHPFDRPQITVASNIKRVADIIIKTGRACYEHNIDITTRFMVDTGIVGGGWITCQKNNIPYTDITIIENTSLPNLKITSFDIECMARPNIFPNPTVIQHHFSYHHHASTILKNPFYCRSTQSSKYPSCQHPSST